MLTKMLRWLSDDVTKCSVRCLIHEAFEVAKKERLMKPYGKQRATATLPTRGPHELWNFRS